jgi:hypothetical protein
VKWNFREIGRTKISRNTLAPRWNNASFLVMTPKNQELKDCSLDLELFDTSNDGKNKLTDFLGCIKIAGDNLVEFLDSERPRWVECEKAKRFHGEENRHVKGFIEVSGTRKDTQIAARAAEEEAAVKAQQESAKLAGFGVSGRFGGATSWFGASSKNLASAASGSDAGDADSSLKSANVPAAAPGLGNLSKKFGLSMKAPAQSTKSIATIQEDHSASDVNTLTPAAAAAHQHIAQGAHALNTAEHSQESSVRTAHAPVPDAVTQAADASLAAQAAPTRAAEARGVPVYLGVVGADGLPSGVEVTCTVRFNSFVVQKLVATSSQDNYMSAKVAFYAAPVTLCIPPGLPLAACELQVSLSREDAQHKVVPIAELTSRGSLLVQFLRRGMQWAETKRVTPVMAHGGGFGATFGASTGLLGHSSADSAQDIRPCRLELIGSYQPIKHEVYQLKVLSARNLPKADVFGSR